MLERSVNREKSMQRRLGAIGALFMMVSLGAAPDPASAKSKREIAAQQAAKITLSDAIAVAQKEISGGKVVDADVSTKDGKVSYAVEIVKEGVQHAVYVDLQDASVVGTTQKRVSPKDMKQLEAVEEAKVTLVEALTIAQKELPGGKALSADVKTRKSKVMYAIDIEKDGLHVVHVDPRTGSVLSVLPKIDD
jgi:uncharacterized membrane protein YkoI